jgi:hypothetical protein
MIAGYRRVMVQFEQLFAFGDSFADASPVVRPSEIADHGNGNAVARSIVS